MTTLIDLAHRMGDHGSAYELAVLAQEQDADLSNPLMTLPVQRNRAFQRSLRRRAILQALVDLERTTKEVTDELSDRPRRQSAGHPGGAQAD